ncbi:ABC-type glycerol-3-phosphate transport system substrate-binding protein [Paenibacillus castaneae]|uniref:extracellular solute-binding protein n=1 Tax=Paenibacillus castaneae TaxID=474957 RepID=UPI000C99DE61|nr:extracellular solute-binding protein [Paenibacillus castaneae]NIK77152.1 ABC-type glycerol-3-phosphate transport system substrate-binding protein [Paenibacillus castaneae]
MKKTYRTLLICLMITALLVSGFQGQQVQAETNQAAAPQAEASADSLNLLEHTYSEKLQEWSEVPIIPNTSITVSPSQNKENKGLIVSQQDSFDYNQETLRWSKDAKITFDINVDQTGLYQLAFDYYMLDESILPTEGYLQINGQYQFYESRNLLFPSNWENKPLAEKWDRYGNELLPRSQKVKHWQTVYAMDSSYFHMEPLKFKLEKGLNTVTLVNTRGELLLGNIRVEAPAQIETYEDYLKRFPAEEEGAKRIDTLLITEAEQLLYKNDSSIRAASSRDSKVTPYDTSKLLLNMIEAGSYEEGGQSLTWELDVPQDGYYHISIKYLQDKQYDLPAFRRIELDGVVPFREVDNYAFPYTKKWRNETLGSEGKPYQFYMTKGKHTLSMTVNLSNMRSLAEDIFMKMKEISRMTLEIKKLTGNKLDLYRDWNLVEYMPDIKQQLEGFADDLDQHFVEISALNPKVKEIGEVVNLKLASKQLRSLAKDPNELPNRLNLFSEGSASASQLLGTLLQSISKSPLALDRIYVFQEGKLPSPNAGFFEKLWETVKRFFLSFTKQSYSSSNKINGELEVWVNRPRPFVELMQKMIDEQFTPQSGIAVKLSIMPDENKLVLANASNRQPDVALGVSNWIPYELAIRNAAMDLRQFKGYEETIKRFSKGAIIPFSFEDGVYALPETQNFWVLFYRKDILDSLKLTPPDTWEEVVEMLPELQRLGMNFYEPLALYKGFKPFNATTPFIYQFDGELFDESGMNTAIDSEHALEGMKFMTDLFTIYNLPQDVPNFYHHFRYGTMPIGISDFNTYIQLKAAAPEIANTWKIALHPGVEKPDGTVARWAPSGGQTGMIFEGTKYAEQSWQFLDWWLSTPVQVEFANLMQTTYGMTFMWNTANLEALEQVPWPEEDKKIISEQFEWVREASRVPGAYMVEREISNVWNRVVFNGDNPRTAIDDAVVRTNREILRKMEEFGYYAKGKMIKPYPVPTITTIDKWVERK